jgi:chromate transport protein ChrA
LNAPGIILIFGFLPLWKFLRTARTFRKIFAGLNAAGVAMIGLAYIRLLFSVVQMSEARAVLHVTSYGLQIIFSLQAQYVILLGAIQGALLGTAWHFGNFTGGEL